MLACRPGSDYTGGITTATPARLMKGTLVIPRIMHTVWVGDRTPPTLWIDTWKKFHPHWAHVMWDNDAVRSRAWVNKKHIDGFMNRGMWAGVADLCRMEILFEYGGFMPGADAMCLRPVDELFTDPAFDAYACYENEQVRAGLVTPVLGSVPGNPILQALIDRMEATEGISDGVPWKVTGNQLVTDMRSEKGWETLKVFPSHYFVPNHYTGVEYRGDDLPYADHQWGSTTGSYKDVTKHT